MGLKLVFFNSKKGMFFTIIAIMLIILFVFTYTTFSIVRDRSSINKRVESLNNFVFSIEEDLGRQLYISGVRSVFLFEKRMSENGVYITNTSRVFSELFFNGTFYGEAQDLMIGATFSSINQTLVDRAKKINAEIVISPNYVFLTQEDPWNIKAVLGANLYVLDKSGLVSWNRSGEFYTLIPLESFEDPLYTINTGGKVIHKIIKTNYSNFVSGSNVVNLSSHLASHYYVASNLAPSFINRLEGNFSASDYGIESFVYLPELTTQGILAEDKSCVDYIYFSNNNPSSYHVQGMLSWFRVDSAHVNFYNISELIY